MSQDPDNKLAEEFRTLTGLAAEAGAWVKSNVAVKDGRTAVISGLSNAGRKSRRMEFAARARPAIAVFGPSQAGKSYLVSNLAKLPEQDTLEIIISETEKLDFIRDINPSGGKESTGLVTRFTTRPKENVLSGISGSHTGDTPFSVRFLSQADIVRVLANGYFSDISERDYAVDTRKLGALLEEYHFRLEREPVPGMEKDDVYEIRDYLRKNFPNEALVQGLTQFDYWESLARIIPYVKNRDRHALLSVIWGELGVLTDLFVKLSEGLGALGFAKEGYCHKNALIPKTIEVDRNGKERRTLPGSIIDVSLIHGLVEEDILEPVEVVCGKGKTITLKRSILSALVSEITLPLSRDLEKHPERSFFRNADVLDFPGARSRNMIPVTKMSREARIEIIEVFLRGKIAFLFDRYRYHLEISSLALCLPYGPQEVMSVPGLVSDWVYSTIGDTPEKRGKKLNSLFVVFTKFNLELDGKPDDIPGNPNSHNNKWDARLVSSFSEYISKSIKQDWIHEWDTTSSFRNCFWLRDPKFSTKVYDGVDASGRGLEKRIKPDHISRLNDMEASFVSHSMAQMFFRDPKKAWQEATLPNKSGIDYLIRFMAPTADPEIKRNSLSEHLGEIRGEMCRNLNRFHRSLDQQKELEKARTKAKTVAKELVDMMKETAGFGKLLDSLLVTDDFVWKTYYDIENPVFDPENEDKKETSRTPVVNVDEDDILYSLGFEEADSHDSRSERKDKADQFAQALISRWLTALENEGQAPAPGEYGITPETYWTIVRELPANLNRIGLLEILARAVREYVLRPDSLGTIDLITRISAMELNRFVKTLGWGYIPVDKRPVLRDRNGQNHPVFKDQPGKTPETIRLDIAFPGASFFSQWVKGLMASFTENVNHAFGGGIENEKENQKLGEILKRMAC